MVDESSELVHIRTPEALTSKEVKELLRIVKKSDYKLVDELSQTPFNISI